MLSALIQNFDTVEDVIEASADSAGSALKENEKYLNSIQGRIDQFNNSVQAMWSNALGSDVVKWFVDVGTTIVKVIDKIGLLNSALIALATISMIKNKMGPIAFLSGISEIIRNMAGKVGGFIGSLMGMTTATSAYTAETLAASVANGTLSASEAANIAAKNGLILTTTKLTATEAKELLIKSGMAKAEALEIVSKLKLSATEKALTADRLRAQMTAAGYKEETIAAAVAAIFGAKSNMTLAASFKALWTAMWPILAVMGGIAAIWGVVELFDAMFTSTEELQEELDEMKSSLSDVQSELESVNQELETTNDRMTELLAKDHLTFVEQEELENLKRVTNELERQKAALEAQEKYEREKVGKQAARVVDSQRNEVGWWMNGKTEEEEVYDDIDEYLEKQNEIAKIEAELANENLSSGLREVLNNQLESLKEDLNAEELDVTDYIDVLTDALDGVKYGDSEQSDAALDYYHNLMDNWNIKQGIEGAKSGAIERIFDKPVFDDASNEIDNLVEKLKENPGDQTILDDIREQCGLAINDLNAVGLTVEDAVEYFSASSFNFDSNTIEGITAQYTKGIDAFNKFKDAAKNADAVIAEYMNYDGTIEKITWGSLFDEDGEVVKEQIAKALQGADETTRNEFARIAKSVNEGKTSVENAISMFSAAGLVQGWQVVEAQVSELNADVFKDLGDEISGVINTVKELSSAFDSVASSIDLVSQAEAEMAYSGHLSVETALQLMESTDDWTKVLKIEEGNIKLVAGAEEALVQTKLDLIKTNLQTALSTVEAQLAQITATEASADMAYTIEESTNLAVTQLAGNMAYLTEMMTAYTKAAAGEEVDMSAVTDAAEKAKKKVLDATNYQKNTAEKIGREELEKEKARLEAMLEMYGTVDTPGEFKSNWSSDEVSGGNDKKEDAEENKISDGWEKLLAKYENKLALLSNERDLIQAEIDKAEARGGKASTEYYDDLIRNSNEEKALLEQKKTALENYLKANASVIDQDTWTEYNNEINETAVAIKECEINTIEWTEAIREIDAHYFEQITDEVSRLGDELDFVNSLLEDEEVADENGNWSSAALTRMGMYTQQMEKAATEAAMYQDEIDEVNEQYKEGALSEEQYQEKLSGLISGQQDAIQSYEAAKDGIVELNEARIDAIKEGIEKEIEAYEDLIDAKKEELDAERDLHDFRENIKDQTKEIGELERRIASLSGSSAASDVAERRRLEAQLMEAKEGLNSSYYDHSRDAQSQALDEEAEAFQLSKERYIEQLEEQLKDTETLISNSIMDVMLNADTVYNELNILADTYGVTLSDSLTQPWKNASAQAIAWKNELKESMTAGEYAALIGEGGAITAFANGVATKLKGSWTQAQTAAKNYAGYLTSEELKNRFTNTLTGFGNQIQAIIDKWNGVKKAADDAYAAQTRTTSVSGNATVSSGSGSGGNGGGNTGSGTASGSGSTTPKKTSTPTRQSPPTRPTFKKVGDLWSGVGHTGVSIGKKTYNKALEIEGGDGIYYPYTNGNGYKGFIKKGEGYTVLSNGKMDIHTFKPIYQKYAKGTMGTKRDEWAITDELGPELTMYATPEGTLSYMRAGSTVVPADLTREIIDIAELGIDGLTNMPKFNSGVTMISNAVNKPEINLSFEALVKAERIDENTLPEVKRFVQQEIDSLVKQMNYAIKGKGGR